MTTAATAIIKIAITILRGFGLASLPVVTVGCAGSAVVGAGLRLIAGSVVCGRMLVSISVAADVASFAVPASLLSDAESLTSAAPSARQNTSASSVSIRLHWGQRFIFGVLRLV